MENKITLKILVIICFPANKNASLKESSFIIFTKVTKQAVNVLQRKTAINSSPTAICSAIIPEPSFNNNIPSLRNKLATNAGLYQ